MKRLKNATTTKASSMPVCLHFFVAAAVTRHANAVVAVVRIFIHHPIQVQEARNLFSRGNPSNKFSFLHTNSFNLFVVYFNSQFLFWILNFFNFFAHCFTY
ncbi:hypothetical protein ERO13_A09G084301v2 [Gossypium hirsutum]|uniref:Uncharacterized protein n=2 Tax=Gossypium TaxID=3633 RepID=A0A5D2P2B6_GOSTO|nr:hypothetical protein ERO13_A09G084301v2 [Gossypium hirsutum]TYH02038.1 hypothetical protein ES288_A09G107000v1 [Gossypium darwinii]TYI09893.1 hypothetical protein ES332_A09G102700v1 [Gossypium tomentosum]